MKYQRFTDYFFRPILAGLALFSLSCGKPSSVEYEKSIWLTQDLKEKMGLTRIIPERDLDRSLIAKISVFSPEGNRFINTSLVLPTAGIAISAYDNDGFWTAPYKDVDDVYLNQRISAAPGVKTIKEYHRFGMRFSDDMLGLDGQTFHNFILAECERDTGRKPVYQNADWLALRDSVRAENERFKEARNSGGE